MTEKGNKKGITRRDFTKSAIVGVGAAVGMGATALAGLGPKEARAHETDVKWDKEVDVVVLGFACAGGPAALAAHDAGAKVLVLEAQAIPGGTTRVSGGCTWIPNNPLMQKSGIKDSREDALSYCRMLAQGQADDELIETFVDKSLEMLEYITKRTPLEWAINGFPDYHPEWPGGKRKGRSINAVKYKGKGYGAALMEGLYDAATDRGIEFMFNTRGKKLITNPAGEVIGIQAFSGVKWIDGDYSGGTSINIKAKKGVILTTGGFEWNQQMVKHYLRGPQTSTVNLPVGQGDSLIMALAVGADVRNLNECWGLPIYMAPGWEDEVKAYQPEKYVAINLTNISAWDKIIADWFFWRGKPGVITVNKYGKRFCNEGADYDTTWRSFFAWENFGETGYPNIPGYVIADTTAWSEWGIAGEKAASATGAKLPDEMEKMRRTGKTAVSAISGWIKQANTLRELAKKLGIDPDGLERTALKFNKHARKGKDPEFHRGESYFDRFPSGDAKKVQEDPEDPAAALAPLETPPFYGVETWPGSCGTCGGPRVNKDAQVVNPFGKAIPGLYAAGNAAGVGAPGASYGAPGGTIGPGMTFGYLAGLHAAKR